jgi:hypothetical protein
MLEIRKPKYAKKTNDNLVGLVFGRLKIIKFLGLTVKGRQRTYLAICKCKNCKTVTHQQLRRQNSSAWRCSSRCVLDNGEAAKRELIRRYKNNAKKRGLEFTLTEKEITALFNQNCFYCGVLPAQICQHKELNGSFIYNGIDRFDNNTGYTKKNSRPCCKDCNSAKSSKSSKEFLAWIQRLVDFRRAGSEK